MYLILDCNNSFATAYLEAVSSWKNHLTSLIQKTVISNQGLTSACITEIQCVVYNTATRNSNLPSDLYHFQQVLN